MIDSKILKLQKSMDSNIEKMLQALLEDLVNGIDQSYAGYRNSNTFAILPSEQRELLKSGIMERHSRGMVRFNFKNTRVRQRLRSFDLQLKQLDYFLKTTGIIKSDLKRLEKVSQILGIVVEKLRTSPEKWAIVIALGWQKMLMMSGMPGLTDEILKEGFSPKDWTLKAISSSPELALEVAKGFSEISSFEEAPSFLEGTGISSPVAEVSVPLKVNPETIRKIKKVLRWTDLIKKLSQETVKMLGFFWFSVRVLESADLMPVSEEVSPKFIDSIWNEIEKLLERNRSALLEELEESMNTVNSLIEQLVGKKINWVESILCLPEIV